MALTGNYGWTFRQNVDLMVDQAIRALDLDSGLAAADRGEGVGGFTDLHEAARKSCFFAGFTLMMCEKIAKEV